jgi:hypothetical protein
MPEELYILAHRDAASHDRLCDAVLEDGGFILISDRLYWIDRWVPVGNASWRWRLVRPFAASA